MASVEYHSKAKNRVNDEGASARNVIARPRSEKGLRLLSMVYDGGQALFNIAPLSERDLQSKIARRETRPGVSKLDPKA